MGGEIDSGLKRGDAVRRVMPGGLVRRWALVGRAAQVSRPFRPPCVGRCVTQGDASLALGLGLAAPLGLKRSWA